jgi:peptidoglycan/xylan/chitin deacetylase (PgdA/CDA1 family)
VHTSYSSLITAIGLSLLAGCGDAPNHLLDVPSRDEVRLLDFSRQPDYLPASFIALTFDDVPDWNHTARVLDVLKDKAVPAAFFINTYNWSDVANEAPMQEVIRRMAREGHEIGNHTARHRHLGELSASEVEEEITTVERLAAQILGPTAPPLTLLRAPYGEPYRDHVPESPTPAFQTVAPVVARHGLHIGWAMDSLDYACPDANCVYDNVMQQIDEGSYGIILMHAVYAATAEALPRLIDTLRERGYSFGSVEDAVKARFGATSGELMAP